MRRLLPVLFILAPCTLLKAQTTPFTAGNLVVLQTDATLKNGSGTLIELMTTATAPQSAVTSTLVPTVSFSGNATSTCYLANSNNGGLLCVTGAINTTNASNVNTDIPRAVITFDINNNTNQAVTYNGLNGEQTRCATTVDYSNYYIADQGGLYLNTASTSTTNTRTIKSFGGTIYALYNSGQISALSGSTPTPLPGVTANSNFLDFYMISSGAAGAAYDVLYVVAATSNTAGTIYKYSYSTTTSTWTANGSATTTFGGYSIAAKTVGTTGDAAELYVTTGAGSLAANSVEKCIDAATAGATISITTPTILYTANGNNTVKGIAFTPNGAVTTPPPTTASVGLILSTNTASEGAQTAVTITATTSAAVTSSQTVTLSVASGGITSDYTLSGTTITIPAGQTRGAATFNVVDDNVTEGLQQDTINISAVTSGLTIGSPSSQILSIQDNDASPTLMRITEYMYDGNNGEFAEFTNIGATAIDMTGWSFDDNHRIPGTVDLSTFGTVQPGESVILTETDASTFRADWNLCPGQPVIGGNTTNLGSDDQINLYDANKKLVDRLTYASSGNIQTKNVSGVVSAAALGIDSIAGWSLSFVGDGQKTVQSNNAGQGVDIGSPGFSVQAPVPFNPCAVVPNAPTIAIDSVNTDISLLGPGKPSSASPYAISGTINDPTDPAATKGLYFTVQSTDPSTPTGDLQVTVTSNNAAVVPQSGLSLTGGVASYLLKITPTSVGYANITLTATNPNGSLATTYTILYAASQTASSSLVWHTGSSDASDGIALDSTYVAIGDDQINKIFVYNRNKPGLPDTTFDYTASNSLNLPGGNAKQLDIEAATPSPTVNGLTYWFGSMSNSSSSYGPEPNRDRIVAVQINGTPGHNLKLSNAGYAYTRAQLIAWGDANGFDFTDASANGQNPKAIDGFNIEGAVFAPDNTTLYFGFRAPLVPTTNRTMAVIAPLQNFETWFQSGGTTAATFGSPIQLDLGGRGIRDMIKLSDGTYVIAAGSYDGTLNPAIYTWTGNASDPAVAQPGFDVTGLNVEGLVGINNADGTLNTNQIQVITDNGSDIPYGGTTENKDLTELNWQKFSTSVVTSTGTPLPIVFISFTAERQTTNADLDWSTGIPGSLSSFSVQRSTDGATFTTIATVTALDGQADYSYVDQNAPATKVYYRIQANERSGQTVLSTIRSLDAGNSNASIQVYPNPVVNGTFTVIIPNTGLKTVSIYNSTGALIEQTAFGDTAKDFSTAGWAKGFYLLRIILPDGSTTTTKLVIP